ncbi:MAG: hypothetical protein COA52_02475 [Hyphomicrobiales bacterium]|nr:MAG: hypothetical protein COA52_02475 [Hyphomicrobiales bacterium]
MDIQNWCARIQFPGKKPVFYGTVQVERGAQIHEVEREVYSRAGACLPDGFKIIDLVPGILIFNAENEAGG